MVHSVIWSKYLILSCSDNGMVVMLHSVSSMHQYLCPATKKSKTQGFTSRLWASFVQWNASMFALYSTYMSVELHHRCSHVYPEEFISRVSLGSRHWKCRCNKSSWSNIYVRSLYGRSISTALSSARRLAAHHSSSGIIGGDCGRRNCGICFRYDRKSVVVGDSV